MEEYKFKAREIVIKMQFQKEPLTFEQAKQCALIAVDEMMQSIRHTDAKNDLGYVGYWQQVKQEIINL